MIIEAINNHYEKLVMDYLSTLPLYKEQQGDTGFLQDIACVALNHLPPKYVRYSVDLVFYMSDREMAEMETRVKAAVDEAILQVQAHMAGPGDEEPGAHQTTSAD